MPIRNAIWTVSNTPQPLPEARLLSERVLEDIGAAQVPQILVYNKCDLLEASRQSRERTDWLEVHPGVRRQRVFVSAVTGEGLPDLRQAIAQHAALRLNVGDPASSTVSGPATAVALPGADPATSHPFPHA